ncbi:MAG: hypothetical protein SGI99_17085 [Pseudomonadota bacterium]|nr:hypothetical protein [Pseudomonadota bacterium]
MKRVSLALLFQISIPLAAAPVDRCDQIVAYQTTLATSGNTVAAFGNHNDLTTCSGQPGASLLPASGQSTEHVIKLRVQTACTLQAVVVGSFSGGNQMDPVVYAANTCPLVDPGITTAMDSSCLAAADATGALGTETISFAAQPNQDYFLFIDGFLAAAGPYTVTLSGCTLIDPNASPPEIFSDGFEI